MKRNNKSEINPWNHPNPWMPPFQNANAGKLQNSAFIHGDPQNYQRQYYSGSAGISQNSTSLHRDPPDHQWQHYSGNAGKSQNSASLHGDPSDYQRQYYASSAGKLQNSTSLHRDPPDYQWQHYSGNAGKSQNSASLHGNPPDYQWQNYSGNAGKSQNSTSLLGNPPDYQGQCNSGLGKSPLNMTSPPFGTGRRDQQQSSLLGNPPGFERSYDNLRKSPLNMTSPPFGTGRRDQQQSSLRGNPPGFERSYDNFGNYSSNSNHPSLFYGSNNSGQNSLMGRPPNLQMNPSAKLCNNEEGEEDDDDDETYEEDDEFQQESRSAEHTVTPGINGGEVLEEDLKLQRRKLKIVTGVWRKMLTEIEQRSNCLLYPVFTDHGSDNKMVMKGTKEEIKAAKRWIFTILNKNPRSDYDDIVKVINEQKKIKRAEIRNRKNGERADMQKKALKLHGSAIMPSVPQEHLPVVPLKFPYSFPTTRKEGLSVLKNMFQRVSTEEYIEAIEYLQTYFQNVGTGVQILNKTEYDRNAQILLNMVYIHGRQGMGDRLSGRLRFLTGQLMKSSEETIPKKMWKKIKEVYVKAVTPKPSHIDSYLSMADKFRDQLLKSKKMGK